VLIPAAVPMAWVFACSNANQGGAAAIGGGVALAMLGTGMRPVTVGFLGWFGPRGLASVVFVLILVSKPSSPNAP
jgi:NhaP-type Na+/H+ or K+/H+ antiporter